LQNGDPSSNFFERRGRLSGVITRCGRPTRGLAFYRGFRLG
jgi:hypothetical protein